MKQRYVQKKLYKLSGWIEIFISIILVIAVMIFAVGLIKNLYDIVIVGEERMSLFNDFLGNAFQIVIGIEFIKMLCKHTPNTVVEVLMFAMARQMVVEHTSPLENILCVLGIAILFLIRRFLFTEIDKEDHYQDSITAQRIERNARHDDRDDLKEQSMQ
ncbi:MAG: transporter [Lachnospiraceae bacterium]|nr:transporter [Lachnospiraceae bacterium]